MSVYVGIDVHRKRSQVAVIDQGGEVLVNRNVPNGAEPILGVIGGLPPGTRSATGPIARRMARNWPTKCRHYLAWSRPSGVRAQLPTVRLNGTRRDPAGTGTRP